MRGGHNAKSTKQHIKDGTYQPVRHAGRLSVPAPDKIPDPPAHFDERHAEKWRSVCQHLLDAEILADQDTDAIEAYVENWFIAADAVQDIRENGATLWAETAQGKKPITNPSFRVYQDCMKVLKSLFDQFGFTPRARMGMKVSPKDAQKPEDPAAKFN